MRGIQLISRNRSNSVKAREMLSFWSTSVSHLLAKLGIDGLHLIQVHAQNGHAHSDDGARGCAHLRGTTVRTQILP